MEMFAVKESLKRYYLQNIVHFLLGQSLKNSSCCNAKFVAIRGAVDCDDMTTYNATSDNKVSIKTTPSFQ